MKYYLCCGRGTGVGPGWTGFDIADHGFRPLVLQDVRTMDRLRNAEAVFATPPCSGFTDLPWRPATGKGLDVLLACLRLCRESGAPWLLENSRFAQRYIGPSRWRRGSHHFWGTIEPLPCEPRQKERLSGALNRAALPLVIS